MAEYLQLFIFLSFSMNYFPSRATLYSLHVKQMILSTCKNYTFHHFTCGVSNSECLYQLIVLFKSMQKKRFHCTIFKIKDSHFHHFCYTNSWNISIIWFTSIYTYQSGEGNYKDRGINFTYLYSHFCRILHYWSFYIYICVCVTGEKMIS